ncbi:Ig-like domain-containing protein [Pontibacter beigongshangensis]|uniref:Ig-like domain-containing protein n=1 Tax=Pontibacter beigongshangensis TaxID=2574733 RepID=UPI00165002C2|nr:T9SS type A sorting domain-containing protein [Pontibacter beigongshangensis]
MLQLSTTNRPANLVSRFVLVTIFLLIQGATLAQANKAPVAQNITTAVVPNNNAVAKTITPLSATDADGSIASFKILTLPENWLGSLLINNVPAKEGQVITPAQAAQLSFRSSINYEATATFTYTATDNKGAVSAPATYAVPIVHDIDLTITHEILASLPFKRGQEVTVRFTITNLGTSPVWDGVHITNFLPSELTFIRSTSEGNDWRYNQKGINNTWNVQALAGKESKTVEIIARVNTIESFSHTSIVSLLSDKQRDHNLGNNGSNHALIQEGDAPAVENVSVTMAVSTAEGSVKAISPLRANVRAGRSIQHFTLTSVPTPVNGTLYVNDQMARKGQQISPTEATALSFEPSPAFEGEAVFTYTATDNLGATSMQPAIYNITIMSMTLPVSLMDFSAKSQGNGAALAWVTASEQDNDFFSVERSQDGQTFKAVGKVKGAGNSSRQLNYSYLDAQAPAGLVYYRLKQVDTDGTHDYSKVITVTVRGTIAGAQVQAYPNPFSHQVNMNLPAASAGHAQLQLLDLQGRAVMTKALFLEQGENKLEIATDSIPAGAYILVVTGNGIDSKMRVIKS